MRLISVLCLIVFLSLQVISSHAAIYCKNDDGQDVDYFISYKIPVLKGQAAPLSTGFSYAFMTGELIKGTASSKKTGWQLSNKLIKDVDSMFGRTLAPVYADRKRYTTALYNDNAPGQNVNTNRAHAKGALVMDKDTGFWLIHSIPNFVPEFDKKYEYPDNGRPYGQTLMCISFNTKKEGNDIAEQLTYMRPNMYALNITDEVAALAPALRVLQSMKWPTNANEHINDISSIKGELFKSFSRSPNAIGDLYSEYVAPKLATDLLVETWRRGNGGPLSSSNCATPYKVNNIVEVNLKLTNGQTTQWKSGSDHAKWAVSSSAAKPFSCIGDINRMRSQSKRGGGTVCFNSLPVWNVIFDSVRGKEECAKNL